MITGNSVLNEATEAMTHPRTTRHAKVMGFDKAEPIIFDSYCEMPLKLVVKKIQVENKPSEVEPQYEMGTIPFNWGR